MADIPPSIPKAVAPFVARARELDGRDPVMSYWCKFKAAQLAMAKIPGDADGRAYLESLMDDLEDSKTSLSDNELVIDDAAGSAYVFNFASKVFDNADKTDRDAKATRMTAKEFLAASNFFEILSIFGPLETDVAEKIKYAKWKATSIAKAFREGRPPTPGPAQPAASESLENGDGVDSSEEVARQLIPHHNVGPSSPPAGSAEDYNFPTIPPAQPSSPPMSSGLPSPTLPSAPSDLPSETPSAPLSPIRVIKPPVTQRPAPSAPLAPPPDIEAEWQPEPSTLDSETIGKAQKHSRFAISALNYEDIETAKKELRLALQLLGD